MLLCQLWNWLKYIPTSAAFSRLATKLSRTVPHLRIYLISFLKICEGCVSMPAEVRIL